MGNSAVRMATRGSSIAPFFRFPDLQESKQTVNYLAGRNVAISQRTSIRATARCRNRNRSLSR